MKVSVIIPVYNGEKYLEKCLDSVINQSYKDLEIIVINDGSVDNTLKLLKEYQKKDNRIIIIDKKNEGQAIARNIGLSKSTGKYVTFIDSDDFVDLNMINDLVITSLKYDSDIVVCDANVIKDNGEECLMCCLNKITDDKKINFILSDPSPWAKLFKSNLLKKINFEFLGNHIYEDLASIPYIGACTSRIKHIDKNYYNYLVHDNSTMKQVVFNSKLNDIFDSLDNLSKLFNNQYKDELEYIYIKHLLHDASLRFLNFKENEAKKSLNKIVKIMKAKYPKWRKNKYLNLMTKNEILLTKIIYRKWYFIYNFYRKVTKKV